MPDSASAAAIPVLPPKAPAPPQPAPVVVPPAPAPVISTTPPATPPKPLARSGSPLLWPLVATGLVLLLGIGGYLFIRQRAESSPATSSSPATVTVTKVAAPTSPIAPPQATPSQALTPTPTPTVTTDPEQSARDQLTALRAADLAFYRAADQWIVQLNSKWKGVSDASQVAVNGTHVFGLVDILAQHSALKARFGSSVKLISSTDIGKQQNYPSKPANEPIWVTIYDPGTLGSGDSAAAWCRSMFPGLTGDALKNVCFPRQASPPH